MTQPQFRQTYDKEKQSFNIAVYRKAGEQFEIIVDPDNAVSYREGKDISLDDVLHGERILSDAQRGLEASQEKVEQVFGTDDPLVVADKILREGEIQFSAQYRKQLAERKRQKIIDQIHKYAVDPRTKYPHPKNRIENAIQEAKVKIDEFKTVNKQVADIVKKLRPIIPITLETEVIQIHIPENYSHKSYSIIKRYGDIKKETWNSDGSLLCEMEIPSGLRLDCIDALNDLTHGGVDVKIIKSIKEE